MVLATISLVTTATTLIFPLNINGFSGSIHSQEVNKKLEFTLDISAERLKSSQSLNLKFEVKKAPFRYGYESDPCRAISYFDTW